MNWEVSLFSIPLWIASFITLLLARYAWRFRQIPGAASFLALNLAVSIWCLGYGFEIAAPGFAVKLLWAKIQYLGIAGVPLFWLSYTVRFTGNSSLLTPRMRLMLLVIPLATLVLAWTNEWHRLIWNTIQVNTQGPFHDLSIQYGTWFWINILYSYLLVFIGNVFLVRFFLVSQGLFRRQAKALLFAAFFPWLGNAMYVLRLNPVPDLDLTPFAFTIAGMIIAWGVFRLQFLDIVPTARHTVVENMVDGVFVLDTSNRIVDLNHAAQALFQGIPDFIGLNVARVFRQDPDLVKLFEKAREGSEKIRLSIRGAEKYFEVRISPLFDHRINYCGRLIMLHDITELEQAKLSLQAARQELEARDGAYQRA